MLSGTAMAAAGVMIGGSPLSAKAAAAKKAAKAKSVIQVFLWGGMSHSDTWDPKPDAGYDWTGQFNKVIGVFPLVDLFPYIALLAGN